MSTRANIAAYFSTIFTMLFGLCCVMVWRFAEKDFPWHSYITLVIGYFVGFGIILVVPIDISSVIQDRNSVSVGTDNTYEENVKELSGAYSTFFTIILIFGSFVLVFEEYYNTDGYFTVLSRLWSSFKRMMFDTVAGIVVGAIVLGVLISEKVVDGDSAALELSAIIVTNTLYEFYLMFLLGYGLVEFPRRFWNSADIEFSLTNQEIKASSDFKDIADAHFAISIEVANALKTQQSLTSSSDKEVGEAIEIIIGECPPEFRSSRAGTVAADKDGKVTIDTLGALRTQLKFFKSRYRMAQAKVESTKLEAYRLEDVINAKHRNTAGNVKFDGVQKIHWALSAESSSEWEYKWEIEYKPYYHKACAIGFGMLSMFSFIGAICSMNGVEPSNSVYFLAVNDDTATAGGIVIFIFFTLGYVVYVSFWALFQMKLAGLMDLVVGGTTPESLSFNVRMVARLAAPLVFFYLGWIAENGLNSGSWVENDAPKLATTDPNTGVVTYSDQQIFMPSAFSNFYQLQSVGIIKTTFGTVFPIILIVFTLMTVTNSYNWICVKLKLEDFQFGTPLVTEEQKREGMRQLEKTKKSTLNKARRSRFLKFLTVAHDSDSVDEPQTGGGGLFSFLLGGSKSNEDEINLNAPQTNDNQSTAEPEIVPPANLSGVVQRKSSGFLGSFKDYYLDVRAPGVLHYFANKEECDNDVLNNKMPPPVDLLTIIDFKVSGKELALQLPDETHNLKFKNEGQCDQWKNQFIEWKDFAVDHGVEYSQMMTDQLNSIDVGLESSMSPLRSATSDSNTSTLNNNNNNNNNNTSTSQSKQAPKISASSIGEDRPTSLNGFVEMKGKSLVSERWDRVYLNVDDKTGYFTVSKSAGGSQLHSMHLPMVQEISAYSKVGATHKRFSVKMDDSLELKFRVETDLDGRRWVTGLNDWKDFLLMNYA